jgi:hypothetical protein
LSSVPNGNGGFSSAYKAPRKLGRPHYRRAPAWLLVSGVKACILSPSHFRTPRMAHRLRAEAATTGPRTPANFTAALKLRREHFVIDGEARRSRSGRTAPPISTCWHRAGTTSGRISLPSICSPATVRITARERSRCARPTSPDCFHRRSMRTLDQDQEPAHPAYSGVRNSIVRSRYQQALPL